MAYTAKDPRPPPTRRFLYLTETKSWRLEEREREGERGEKVHLLTHTPLGGRVGKKGVLGGPKNVIMCFWHFLAIKMADFLKLELF